ncbi:MAG: hypothetical protein GY719_40355 [bacterium]|nr:hypothetical protein [bacterium]
MPLAQPVTRKRSRGGLVIRIAGALPRRRYQLVARQKGAVLGLRSAEPEDRPVTA